MAKAKSLAEWLAARPEPVRRVLARWPLGSVVTDGQARFYVIGAAEEGHLIVSPVHPARDYDRAMAERVLVCADCLARGLVHRIGGDRPWRFHK